MCHVKQSIALTRGNACLPGTLETDLFTQALSHVARVLPSADMTEKRTKKAAKVSPETRIALTLRHA
jgi:hypothetical protein